MRRTVVEQATEIRMPHGWRTIVLPERIEALPKDRKGFPIPWVAEWSSRTQVDLTMLDGFARMDCDCTIGVGEPMLGAQCPNRQRRCVSERRCQVCSFPIAEDEDCHFLGADRIQVFWEPPLHQECAAYSLQVCPGITRRAGMSVHVVRDYKMFDRFENPLTEWVEFTPTGKVPALVRMGLMPSVFIYHGAQPVGGQRHAAADWLAAINQEV